MRGRKKFAEEKKKVEWKK